MTERPRSVSVRTGNVVLVADDFAISGGVSAGIESLARQRRISAASAIVTLPRWRYDAPRLAALRAEIAIGLHINFTLLQPLGAMPDLAPRGLLPAIGALTLKAVARRIDVEEIAAETTRQLAAFESATGFPPDVIDGHQHVHALPKIREGVMMALAARYRSDAPRPLLRVPADRAWALAARRQSFGKAAVLSLLAAGTSDRFRRAGFPVNDSFAGVTSFAADAATVARDIDAARVARRGLHIAMCHPGLPTAELAEIDAITDRRAVELAVLGADNALTAQLWHPARPVDGAVIDWKHERGAMP